MLIRVFSLSTLVEFTLLQTNLTMDKTVVILWNILWILDDQNVFNF